MDLATIENNFTYHKPFGNQQERYEMLRANAKKLALSILRNCPSSREQSLAFTKLEEAVMWANAAIARNEKEIWQDELDALKKQGLMDEFNQLQRHLVQVPIQRSRPKTGRNEPCPCGSGKKFKKCCLSG